MKSEPVRLPTEATYFGAAGTDPNVVLRFDPTPFTTVISITEIEVVMRPCSTVLAALSSRRVQICSAG
jgi:hypothetical protein